MKYTKTQKKFWTLLFLGTTILTFCWYQVMSKPHLERNLILGLMIGSTIFSTLIHFWTVRIVRSKKFVSTEMKDGKYPTDVHCWNMIQKNVPRISILIFLVPITIAYFLAEIL